jgi:ELWxxDGT repeat protein
MRSCAEGTPLSSASWERFRSSRASAGNGDRRLRIESLEQRQLLSVAPTMVADANDADAHPSMNVQQLTAVGDVLYFNGSVEGAGTGLWRTDGTIGGTVLVKELAPSDNYSITPNHLANVAGKLFFWTNAGDRYSLWTSEGSEASTTLLKEFGREGTFGIAGYFVNWMEVNGDYYFAANDGIGGSELWKSDGTAAGTVQVAEIREGAAGSSPRPLANLNGTLYFTADSGSASLEFWRTDGTAEGTFRVVELPTTSKYLSSVTTTGDRFFFNFSDGVHGTELWTSDGTAAGTTLVKDLHPESPGYYGKYPSQLVNVNGVLYFTAQPGYFFRELWRSDGTAAGTYRISAPSAPSPTRLTNVDGTLFFIRNDNELWKSDGTEAGSVLAVKPPVAEIGYLINADGVLYFTGGNGIWKTDGTAEKTQWLKETTSGASPTIQTFATLGESLYFSAEDPIDGGEQLWRTAAGDGTGVEVLNPTAAGTLDGNPTGLTVVGDWMYYISRSGTHWTSLWKTDGSNAELVKNLRPAPTSLYERRPVEMVNVSGTLYFTATDGEHGYELWKSDGTAEGTLMLKDVNTYDQSLKAKAPTLLTNVDGTLYFVGENPPFDSPQVWISDGTAEGTAPAPGRAAYANRLVNFNGELHFFTTFFSSHLWKTGGTTGTVRITPLDEVLQVAHGLPLVAAGDSLYFVVNDATSGRELWKSDGTAAGTKLVRDITPGAGSTPIEWLMNVGERLYFTTTMNNGHQLWSSDGTAGGTVQLATLPRESHQRLDFNFTTHNGHVYFTAGSDSTLPEKTSLWRTDGTVAGTSVVAEFSDEPLYQRHLASVDDRLYLIGALSFASGYQTVVWENPMRPGSTHQIVDDVKLTFSYLFNSPVTAFKSNIYFSANDGEHGEELWRLFSPTALAGDYTDDGIVNGADFLAWQRSFGSAASPAGSGADGDGDGLVGSGDLILWKENFCAGGSLASTQQSVAVAALLAEEETDDREQVATSEALAVEIPRLVASQETTALRSGKLVPPVLDWSPPFEGGEEQARRAAAREALFAAGDFSRLFLADGDGGAENRWGGAGARFAGASRTTVRAPAT